MDLIDYVSIGNDGKMAIGHLKNEAVTHDFETGSITVVKNGTEFIDVYGSRFKAVDGVWRKVISKK